jgi:transposase-like protein
MNEPKTLQQAIVYFSDPERAFAYVMKFRWPDGKVTCPRCGSEKNSFVKTRKLWFCYGCKRQFTLKVKTIFEDSPLGLDKWMAAFWMLANCKNGISSYELAKALGIHQGSAWFMLQRIREVMKVRSFGGKIGGEGSEIEVDETFVGGRAQNMHKDKRIRAEGRGPYKNKTIVHGILDRDLRQVRTTVVPNVARETLQDAILKNVKFGSTVYTDNAVAYDNGLQRRFVHDVVNKTEAYVRGRVHVNGMENFWSLLKRSLKGTYVAVEPFHLSRYVDEQAFRYNHRKDGDRKLTDADRFAAVMSHVLGRRLTYSDLTGKSDSPHHETTGARQTAQA